MLENLSDVRVFAQVFESGGLTAAGKVLRLPTNQVSRRLSRLESALGVRLFDRTTRKVVTTAEGRSFYPRALRLLESAREAEEVSQRQTALEGAVRVAVRTTTIEFGFVAALSRRLLAHEELSVQLLVRDEPLDLVAEGLDVAVMVGSLPDSSHVARLVGRAEYVLAASPAYLKRRGAPETPAQLAEHQALRRHGMPPETEWTLVGPRQKEVSVAIGGRFECNDSRALATAVEEGLGIGLRPAREVQASRGRLVRVLPAWKLPLIPVWAVSPPGRTRLARVALVVDVLRSIFEEKR